METLWAEKYQDKGAGLSAILINRKRFISVMLLKKPKKKDRSKQPPPSNQFLPLCLIKMAMKYNNKTRKYELEKMDKNVVCPFCGQPLKGGIPDGLKLKKIAKLISRLTLAEMFEKQNPPQ